MSSDTLKIIGKIIREIRKQKGLTQEQLAEKAQTTFSYIGGVERGERNITIQTLEKICDALGVHFFDLMYYHAPLNHNSVKPNQIIIEINNLLLEQNIDIQKKVLNILKEVFRGNDN
jgi:transcriptional regulator with XRE-family HTH domain